MIVNTYDVQLSESVSDSGPVDSSSDSGPDDSSSDSDSIIFIIAFFLRILPFFGLFTILILLGVLQDFDPFVCLTDVLSFL